MRTRVTIEAGICGFRTSATALCEDSQHVAFAIESGCERVAEWARQLAAEGPLDAYGEIDPRGDSRLLAAGRSSLAGCCAGCAVSIGLFKAMQVAAGLALPEDVTIQLETTDE